MSYATLSTASISLALVAVAVAIAAVILFLARRRRWAHRALTLMVVVLAGAAGCALFAASESKSDLQARTNRVLVLAAAAERVAFARSGRYTTSISTLQRLSPALAEEIRLDGASVQATTNAITRRVRLQTSLYFGTKAVATLRSGARSNRLAGHRGARNSAT